MFISPRHCIAHRVNQLNDETAKRIFQECDGIEFDIRDSGGELIVCHDAFATVNDCQRFDEFVQYCPTDKLYIVNAKAEGIEERAIAVLEARGIRNFFLLDCGMPAMYRLSQKGETRLAIRFSEYESLETVRLMKDLVQWVWVDVFSVLPLTAQTANQIREWGLKICLVSPELQGQQDKLVSYKKYLEEIGANLEAVCTKNWNISAWRA
jgi:hypothetical protein